MSENFVSDKDFENLRKFVEKVGKGDQKTLLLNTISKIERDYEGILDKLYNFLVENGGRKEAADIVDNTIQFMTDKLKEREGSNV